ncbi:transglycosylase SLT domain-containing protein [Pseudoroseicyclus aestuarii]|uniref:Transglycosylase-like protein with SLT domain n=1 Tax=Pseudoroseicyclus aestuarii TaxID=1795041 RepID=A0A318STJ5_9RHOB|nr:transglycosylase SLT domain-containing protein [Pseudoroseicyclus aestuarii]PYE82499.1 transglycosylase-like protein with SLT domain [Pseudoroseicyclus aestuarii]
MQFRSFSFGPVRRLSRLAVLPVIAVLAACAQTPAPEPAPVVQALPVMAWDHRPEADQWTETTLAALDGVGAPLVNLVPGDIAAWCPGYTTAAADERAAFWAGMFSALARYESTWNPEAVGGGGQWFGLVQISPATARGYGCNASTGQALKDGAANLSCAVRIAARTVLRDGVVASGRRGLAADWGPFHSSAARNGMAEWVSQQDYCKPEATTRG